MHESPTVIKQKKVFQIDENTSFIADEKDFSKFDVIEVHSLDNFIVKEGSIVVLPVYDYVQKLIVDLSTKVFKYNDTFIFESTDNFYTKAIANLLIEERIPFNFLQLSLKEYNKIIYNKDNLCPSTPIH